MNFILNTLLIILIILYLFDKKVLKRNIQQKNRIWFLKLKKDTLNSLSDEDLKDLISYLTNELFKRKEIKRYESKKSRNIKIQH